MVNTKTIISGMFFFSTIFAQLAAFSDTSSFNTRIGHFTITDQVECSNSSEKIMYTPFDKLGISKKGHVEYTDRTGAKTIFAVKYTFTGPVYSHKIKNELTVIMRIFTESTIINEYGHPNPGPMIDIVRTKKGLFKMIDSQETPHTYLVPHVLVSNSGLENCKGLEKSGN